MNIPNTIFSSETSVSKNDLTKDEIDFFKLNGWIGKFPLLTPSGVEMATSIHNKTHSDFTFDGKATDEDLTSRPWFKSMHVTIPEYRAIATHPFIVNKVASILGENIIAWGVSTTQRQPGQRHRWHVDIEHKYWKGVSVFVGLKGTSQLSSLSIIAGSHTLHATPQQLGIDDNDKALEYCKNIKSESQLVTVDIDEGDCFLFDGLLWHSSDNKGDCCRIGLILQYSTPAYEIKIPRNWDEPIEWHSSKPQSVLARGIDNYNLNSLK